MNFKKAAIIQVIIIAILVGGIMMNSTIDFTDNDYSPAGITDNHSFELFYMSFYDDIDTMNQTPIALAMHYPLKVTTAEGDTFYVKDRKEFYDKIFDVFTKDVKKAVLKQKLEDVKIVSKGVVIGDNVVVMGVDPDSEEEGYKVLEINQK